MEHYDKHVAFHDGLHQLKLTHRTTGCCVQASSPSPFSKLMIERLAEALDLLVHHVGIQLRR